MISCPPGSPRKVASEAFNGVCYIHQGTFSEPGTPGEELGF